MPDNSLQDPESTLVPSSGSKRKRGPGAEMEHESAPGEGASDGESEPRVLRKKARQFEPRRITKRPTSWHLKRTDIPDGALRTKVMLSNWSMY